MSDISSRKKPSSVLPKKLGRQTPSPDSSRCSVQFTPPPFLPSFPPAPPAWPSTVLGGCSFGWLLGPHAGSHFLIAAAVCPSPFIHSFMSSCLQPHSVGALASSRKSESIGLLTEPPTSHESEQRWRHPGLISMDRKSMSHCCPRGCWLAQGKKEMSFLN